MIEQVPKKYHQPHNSQLDLRVELSKKSDQNKYINTQEKEYQRPKDRNLGGKLIPQPNFEDFKSENFERIEKKKTSGDIEYISNALKNHFVFYRLSDSDRKKLSTAFFYCTLKKDELIISQGDDAATFFILEQGKVQILVNNEPKRILNPGDGFGELALLYNSKRTASVKAMENIALWGIDRTKFKFVVAEMSEKEYKENLQFIDKVSFFQNLTRQQKDGIASVLIEQKFNKDQDIINENDPASSFYMIKTGVVSVLKDNKEFKTLQQGASFGESALLTGEQIRTTTIRAKEQTICLALGKDILTKILGNKVEEIIFRNIAKWTFEKAAFGPDLEPMQIEHLLDHVIVAQKKEGDVVLPKGTVLSEQILLVLQGEVLKQSDKKVVGQKFSRICDNEVFMGSTEKSIDTLLASKDCVVGYLTNKSIQKELGCNLQQIVVRNKEQRSILSKREKDIQGALDKLQLDELKVFKHLGAGQFGNVYLVKAPKSDELFALKCINKTQVVQQHLEKYVKEEKKILAEMNFPFIMRFYRSLNDTHYVFFLLEFIQGMELFDVIREIGLLSTFDCQFYIGSIILAIEYMHKNHIIYRDIKPENIMVTNEGYSKIVDLGTAHKFKGDARTATIIGTPHYMAPEVLSGKGYSYYVDLWSTGICLYEFMCGFVPFGEDAEDPYEIYELIIKQQKLNYPNYVKDREAKELMEQLLSKSPEIRLGGSFNKLKRHKWFSDFSWEQLLEQKLKAPWQPPKEKQINVPSLLKRASQAPSILAIDDIQKNRKGSIPKSKKDPEWDKIF